MILNKVKFLLSALLIFSFFQENDEGIEYKCKRNRSINNCLKYWLWKRALVAFSDSRFFSDCCCFFSPIRFCSAGSMKFNTSQYYFYLSFHFMFISFHIHLSLLHYLYSFLVY